MSGPFAQRSETFLPPLPPASPCIPSSTHPSKSVALLVAGRTRRPAAQKRSDERPPPGPLAKQKKVLYVEPLQNATSRRILATYYQRQPNVPVDWRNGLDMRTLAPAQDPNYLTPQQTSTFETNTKSRRPYYDGGLLNQLRHGYGKCQYRNAGFSYEGEWMHGRTHGHGKLQLPDGVYEGDFRSGEITGSGMKVWSDGTQYTGEFLDGEMHGQGLFLRSNGERYEGGFVRNQRSGHGVLVMPDGTRYDGLFEEHHLNGHGTCEASNGDHYDGEWCNGNMDGMGEYWYGNGDHYVGRFARNLREGRGCMFLASSGIKLDCDWECDLPVNVPCRLVAESPERLFWQPPPPPPPPPKEEGADGEEEDEAAQGDEEPEPPVPPPSLKEILAAPLAPGSTLPPFFVTVEGSQSHVAERPVKRPQTPGGGIAGTTPQLGESGRLIFLTFGTFDREEPLDAGQQAEQPVPPEGEEAPEPPPPPFKRYPTSAVAIYLESPPMGGADAPEVCHRSCLYLL
jgi:hypothetical protein